MMGYEFTFRTYLDLPNLRSIFCKFDNSKLGFRFRKPRWPLTPFRSSTASSITATPKSTRRHSPPETVTQIQKHQRPKDIQQMTMSLSNGKVKSFLAKNLCPRPLPSTCSPFLRLRRCPLCCHCLFSFSTDHKERKAIN